MGVYLVTMDVRSGAQTHQNVLREIRQHKNCKVIDTMYFVEASLPATELRDYIMDHLSDHDVVHVVSVKNEWAANRNTKSMAWLRSPDRRW